MVKNTIDIRDASSALTFVLTVVQSDVVHIRAYFRDVTLRYVRYTRE